MKRRRLYKHNNDKGKERDFDESEEEEPEVEVIEEGTRSAGLQIDELDELLSAPCTPDTSLPPNQLGLPVFDISDFAQCDEDAQDEEAVEVMDLEVGTSTAPRQMIPGLEFLYQGGCEPTVEEITRELIAIEKRRTRVLTTGHCDDTPREAHPNKRKRDEGRRNPADDFLDDYPVREEERPKVPTTPFDMRTTREFDVVACQKCAEDVRLTIPERIQKIVDYCNHIWVKINDNGPCKVGVVQPNPQSGGYMSTIIRQDKHFFQALITANVMFPLEATDINAKYLQEISVIFGPSLEKKSLPKARPGRKARPDEEEEHGRVVFSQRPVRIKVNVAKLWYYHPSSRVNYGITYNPIPWREPGCASHEVLNAWQGFAFLPEEVEGMSDGDHPRTQAMMGFLKHMRDIVCAEDLECFDFLRYWVAHMIQRPGSTFHSVPVLIGPEGVGKGIFYQGLKELVGRWQFLQTSKSSDLIGHFTDQLFGQILVFLDEAYKDNGSSMSSDIKVIITEENFRYRPLYSSVQYLPKFFRLGLASNDESVIEAGPSARRYCVLKTSESRMNDKEYFKKITDDLAAHNNEGYKALFDYFHSIDLEEADAKWAEGRMIPRTLALMNQQLDCLGPFDGFVWTVLFRGYTVDKNRLLDSKDEGVRMVREALSKDLVDQHKVIKTKHGVDSKEEVDFRQRMEQGEHWEQLVSVSNLYAIYKREALPKIRNSRENLLTEGHFLDMLKKTIYGPLDMQKYEKNNVRMFARRNDIDANRVAIVQKHQRQADTDELVNDHWPVDTVFQARKYGSTEIYIVLPELWKARANFSKYMKWDKDRFTPFVEDRFEDLEKRMAANIKTADENTQDADEEEQVQGRHLALLATIGH
jgi:hypothetical protein